MQPPPLSIYCWSYAIYPDSAVFLFLLIADPRDCDVREAGTHHMSTLPLPDTWTLFPGSQELKGSGTISPSLTVVLRNTLSAYEPVLSQVDSESNRNHRRKLGPWAGRREEGF